MEFIVEDYKGRNYKVNAQEDCDGNKGGLYCMVYRAIGIGGNEYDYGEMEYEEDYFADFCIHPEDCDCTDETEVEDFINEIFSNKEKFEDWVYNETLIEKIMNNPINKLKKEYADIADDFLEIKGKYRTAILSLMKALLEKYNGEIDFNDDIDFLEVLGYSIGNPTITYDGGSHPEYKSNAFSEVYGAKLIGEKIFIICEDNDEYSIDRVWSVDELENIVDALDAYDNYMAEKVEEEA